MPVYSACEGALACKLVSFYPGNAEEKKPTHQATIMLYDPAYGELKAVCACAKGLLIWNMPGFQDISFVLYLVFISL